MSVSSVCSWGCCCSFVSGFVLVVLRIIATLVPHYMYEAMCIMLFVTDVLVIALTGGDVVQRR